MVLRDGGWEMGEGRWEKEEMGEGRDGRREKGEGGVEYK